MIEVLKQALAALEVSTDWDLNATGKQRKSVQAIMSLRQAIAELESQESNPIKDGWQLSFANGHSGYGVYAHMDDYPEEGAFLLLPIKKLESQEPVAWVAEDICKGQHIDGRPRKIWWECEKGVGTAFYTHPPQRTWQGLTDEDIGDEYVRFEVSKGGFNRFEYAVRAIEAKLKEKNT